jgi:predicted nucleotidyltransferase
MGLSPATARRRSKASLADALFTKTQQRVLGLLFGQPDRSFYSTEVMKRAGTGSGAAQRALAKLEHSGLVNVSRVGHQKHYQANSTSPLFHELHGIVLKTVGLAEPLRRALAPRASEITAAFVYGSIAKGTDRSQSDIDLMVLSDTLTYGDLFGALETASADLGRKINPTVYARAEVAKRLKTKNAFMTGILAQPKVWVMGSEHDFAA